MFENGNMKMATNYNHVYPNPYLYGEHQFRKLNIHQKSTINEGGDLLLMNTGTVKYRI